MAKSKVSQAAKQPTARQAGARRQLDQARRDHVKGTICTEDYIWVAMQCYAAEARASRQ